MFCQRCGTQLSDDAQFCMRCGQPQSQASSASSQQWEHCKIVYSVLKTSFVFQGRVTHWCFEGEVIGPKGTYTTGRSMEMKDDIDFVSAGDCPVAHRRDHKAACDELMQQLISKGWELTGEKGDYWWQYKFRRPFQPWDYCTIEWDRMMGGAISFGNNRWCFMAKSTGRDASTKIMKYDSMAKSVVRVAATTGQIMKYDGDVSATTGCPSIRNASHVAACEELKQQLISKGWELSGEKGANWWSYIFRRSPS